MPSTSTAERWDALTVLCAVVFLDALDVSMVGAALPSIQAELGIRAATLISAVPTLFGFLIALTGLRAGPRTAELAEGGAKALETG